MLRRCALAMLLSMVPIAPALPSAATPTVDVVASGSSAIGETALGQDGTVVYRFGAGTTGIASWKPGSGGSSVATGGAPAAGGAAGEVYASFGFQPSIDNYGGFVINDAGKVAFKNGVAPVTSSGHNDAIWGPGAGGNLSILARWGQPLASGPPGALVDAQSVPFPGQPARIQLSGLTLDDSGRTTFSTVLQVGIGGVTSNDDTVLYRSDGNGGGSILAREGDQAPGTAPGTTYLGAVQGAGSFNPIESHFGTSFRAATTAGMGIFGEDGGGGFTPLVFSGDAAPGTSGALFASTFLNARVDASGDLTFQNTLQTGVGGVTSANDTGFWGPDGSGVRRLIAREGDQAPGATPGALFSTFASPDFGDAGIAFRATLSGAGVTAANDTGLWRPDNDGGVILLAREGDAVGALPGATFADMASTVIAVNAIGQTAFGMGMTVGQGGVTAANDRALFFADSNGLLSILLREGELIPSLGVLRDLAVEPGGFNDAGQILVRAQVDIGGGVLTSPLLLVSIPEPSTGLLVTLGVGLLAAGRRGRGQIR